MGTNTNEGIISVNNYEMTTWTFEVKRAWIRTRVRNIHRYFGMNSLNLTLRFNEFMLELLN